MSEELKGHPLPKGLVELNKLTWANWFKVPVIKQGICQAVSTPDDIHPHVIVTYDWIQKCGLCGKRNWLGLL